MPKLSFPSLFPHMYFSSSFLLFPPLSSFPFLFPLFPFFSCDQNNIIMFRCIIMIETVRLYDLDSCYKNTFSLSLPYTFRPSFSFHSLSLLSQHTCIACSHSVSTWTWNVPEGLNSKISQNTCSLGISFLLDIWICVLVSSKIKPSRTNLSASSALKSA